MPEIIKVAVYKLDELAERAKENARAWYRESAFDYDWYDFAFGDFETICEILGIDLRANWSSIADQGRRQPQIFFTGFCSQGDGACFAGAYAYRPGASRDIRVHAPQDATLHQIADTLRDVQRRHFYQLTADIRHRGRYCHEYSMEILIERGDLDVSQAAEETITEVLRDLARWLYRQLEREYDHLSSDPAVDEAIAINEYRFTSDGRRTYPIH